MQNEKIAIDDQKRTMMHDDLNKVIDWINTEIEKFENTPGENYLDRSTRIKRFMKRYCCNWYPLYTISAKLTTNNFGEIKVSFPLSLAHEVKKALKEKVDMPEEDGLGVLFK